MNRWLPLILTLFSMSALRAQDPQVEFTAPLPLLAPDGSLDAWGWARRALMTYNRDAIPAEKHGRVKEWEHYTVMSPKFTVGVTVASLGSLSFGSVEIIDYTAQSQRSAMFMKPQPNSRSLFPPNPYGSTDFRNKESFVTFQFEGKKRRIVFNFPGGANKPAFEGKLELVDDPAEDSIALARPFSEPGQFFYENKIFGMAAAGMVTVDGETYALPVGESFAIFDWGRGIWPRSSQWFWGQGAGKVGDHRLAINLGHGYGDDTRGTANGILIDGKLHKLHDVVCEYDPKDRMKPWTFTSDDYRLSLKFIPTYHQQVNQNIGIASAELHKIHGHYSGKLVVGDQSFEVTDLLGFAEHMTQRW